jgi:uncharacterized protein (TIGR03067 family)
MLEGAVRAWTQPVEETTMPTSALWILTAGLALAAQAPEKKDLDLLQGKWKVVSVEHNGKTTPSKETAKWNLVVAGDKMTSRDGDQVMEESILRLDISVKPKAIDLKFTTGPDKDKTVRGIYQVEGDKLTICVGVPNKDRPKEFRAPEGSDCTLFLFEKVK